MEDTSPILTVTQSGYSLPELATFFVALAILGAGILSVVYIFIGGISFILSGGQEDKIKQAVQTIRYAIIGLFITIFAVTLVSIVGNVLGYDLTSVFQMDRIKDVIRIILNSVSGGSGSTPTPNETL